MSTFMIDLVQRCARRMGDSVPLEATATVDDDHFEDSFHVSEISRHWPGAQVLITSGTLQGEWSTITDVVNTDQLLLSPALSGTITSGTKAVALKLRAKGWEAEEYFYAINDAIMDLQGRVLISQILEVEDLFSRTDGLVLCEDADGNQLDEVYRVQVYDTRCAVWSDVRVNRHDGWWPDEDGSIRLSGDSAWYADGRQVKLFGYQYQQPLADWTTDPLRIPAQPVISKACLDLNHGGIDRDTKFSPLYEKQDKEFERELRGYATFRASGTRKVVRELVSG